MAGVYIPGVRVPSADWATGTVVFLLSDGTAQFTEAETLEHKNVKFVRVPDHGNLFDWDVLWKELKSAELEKLGRNKKSVLYDAGFLAGFRAAAQIASKTRTIIPADDGEEGGGA